MSSPIVDNTLQQQQQAQKAQQSGDAAKAANPASVPKVKFAEVLKSQQQNKGGSSVKMLKENPVGGAEVVKSAVTGGKTANSKIANAANANKGTSSSGTTGGSLGAASSDIPSSATSGADSTMAATKQMMEMNQDFNLQYLNLQSSVQAESRKYTAVSNVSKTKSDTAKNSLSNVK